MSLVICQYCDKSFSTSFNRKTHESTCNKKEFVEYKIKSDDTIEKYFVREKQYQEQIDQYKLQLSDYSNMKLELALYKREIKHLREDKVQYLDLIKTLSGCKQETSLIQPQNRIKLPNDRIDISDQAIALLQHTYTREMHNKGIDGVVRWTVDNVLTSSTGKLLYTRLKDKDEIVFTYIDTNGKSCIDEYAGDLYQNIQLGLDSIMDEYDNGCKSTIKWSMFVNTLVQYTDKL
jgi:hypothetical protein